MQKKFFDELSALKIDGISISSLDIWLGLPHEHSLNNQSKDGEHRYMTHAFSTIPEQLYLQHEEYDPTPANQPSQNSLKRSLGQYVNKYSRFFLGLDDKNVQRALKTQCPIIYNPNLVDPDTRQMQRRLQAQIDEPSQSVMSLLVPVSAKVEPRWKALLWMRITKEASIVEANFIHRHQQQLLELADHCYAIWRIELGGDCNLYHLRGIFCHNAIAIAHYLVEGYSAKEISDKLEISPSGVEYHIDSMKAALNAKNRAHLVAELIRKGIVT